MKKNDLWLNGAGRTALRTWTSEDVLVLPRRQVENGASALRCCAIFDAPSREQHGLA